MSFEGYYQCLCKNGHYFECDIYECEEIKMACCPICGKKIAWWNIVDTTNGSHDYDGTRIDNFFKLDIKKQKICDKCGSVLEIIYNIPRKDE